MGPTGLITGNVHQEFTLKLTWQQGCCLASYNSRNLWFLGLGQVAALGSQSFEVIHLVLYRDNGKENGTTLL